MFFTQLYLQNSGRLPTWIQERQVMWDPAYQCNWIEDLARSLNTEQKQNGYADTGLL